jgi:hypothetical protein
MPATCANASAISTPGQDRHAREVPLEEGLVDGDALDRDGALARIHLEHPVDHEEWIAVREQLHDLLDVESAARRRERRRGPVLVVVHRSHPLDELGRSANAVAARSQRRCSIAGSPLTRAPDGRSSWTMLATPTVTSSPSVRCPSTPDFAASVVRRPSRARSGDPAERDEQAVGADVGGVADLHEVVELRSAAHVGVAERGAIDAAVRADLDVVLDDRAPDLRDLHVAVRRPARSRSPRCRRRRPG